jgi:glycosyltransferase involved in cell wall biosynthesis
MSARVFVVVAAYNEAERIAATLAALGRAFPGARVLLGDDGSSDATAQIARERGARVVRSERVIGKGGVATLAASAALREAETEAAKLEAEAVEAVGGDSGAPAVFVLCDGDLADSAAALVARSSPARPISPSRCSAGAWAAASGLRSASHAGRSAGAAACRPPRRSQASGR